jgi:hypothetical protein
MHHLLTVRRAPMRHVWKMCQQHCTMCIRSVLPAATGLRRAGLAAGAMVMHHSTLVRRCAAIVMYWLAGCGDACFRGLWSLREQPGSMIIHEQAAEQVGARLPMEILSVMIRLRIRWNIGNAPRCCRVLQPRLFKTL